MSTRREVLSPISNTPVSQQQSSEKFVSPSTSHDVGLQSPVTQLNSVHDYEKERKERRRSRILDLQRKHLGSPNSPSDRVTPLNGLSNMQLAEHYEKCIKLSVENKINSKNAFGLHLIDCMSEMLNKKELENFQVASYTLDASAKIYAARVDFMHAEAYKLLSELGRGSDKSKNTSENDNLDADIENNEQEEEGQKKKRKAKKSRTVETNLKNISMNKSDIEFEVDPMFHIMSGAFAEGGSDGLLLSNLRCFDDTQQLVLDSSTVIPVTDNSERKVSERKPISDTAELKDLLQKADLDNKQICPAFHDFTFCGWDNYTSSTKGQSDFIFDMNAEPEPIPQVEDEFPEMQSEMAAGLSGSDAEDDVIPNETSECKIVEDSRTAQLMDRAFEDLTHGSTGTLLQILASEPSDYSYFKKAILQTWAGPSHWRIGNLSKDSRLKSMNKPQKSKIKKSALRIDYDQTDDCEYFKKSKTTTLTKRTLSGYSKDQTTLPPDLHYDVNKLFKLFYHPKIMIKRQSLDGVGLDQLSNSDHNNTNDRENFCADLVEDDDDNNEFDFNFSGDSGDCSQGPSQNICEPSLQMGGASMDGTVLCGDKLLAQPYKVPKIDIPYAKTAKKHDVRKLKSAMWKILTSSTSEQCNEDAHSETNISKGIQELTMGEKSMTDQWSIGKLLQKLPQHISENAATNLSVPIAFMCLLHLATEKGLKLESIDMKDVMISQDL